MVNEHSVLTPSQFGSDYFRVGVVREPCDYYVSEYFWGRTGRGITEERKPIDPGDSFSHGAGWLAFSLAARGREALYGGDATPGAFASWVEEVALPAERDAEEALSPLGRPPRCGLESIRFWTQVAQPLASERINKANQSGCENTKSAMVSGRGCPCPLGECAREASNEAHAKCVRDIEDFDLSKFDCWLRLQTVDEDLELCLRKFRSRGGTTLLEAQHTRWLAKAASSPAVEIGRGFRENLQLEGTTKPNALQAKTMAKPGGAGFVSSFGSGFRDQQKIQAPPAPPAVHVPSSKEKHAGERLGCSEMHTNRTAEIIGYTEGAFAAKFSLGRCCSR